ncbi:hypothetical protein RJZ56_007327 [Blastomyces dermatitidis]
MVQSLQLSIRECSEPEDEQMCNLIEDLIREQNLLENEHEQSSSVDKAQLSILRVPVSQKLVNDFVDTILSSSPAKSRISQKNASDATAHQSQPISHRAYIFTVKTVLRRQ